MTENISATMEGFYNLRVGRQTVGRLVVLGVFDIFEGKQYPLQPVFSKSIGKAALGLERRKYNSSNRARCQEVFK